MKHAHKIAVKGGGHALVDMCDAELVKQYSWHWGGSDRAYVASSRKGQRSGPLYLHRLVMGAGDGDTVDHLNGNRWDCRRQNLRLVTRSQNGMNRSFTRNATGYRGVVHMPKRSKSTKFQARLTANGGVFRGPYRANARAAAKDFDALARALHGEHGSFNFPRDGERHCRPIGGA